MNMIRIRIGLLTSETLRLEEWFDSQLGRDEAPPTPPDDENHYWTAAIEGKGKFCYRVNGITVDITEDQYRMVIKNPYLYYFSTALKLHLRIKRAKDGLPKDAPNC